MSLWDAMDWARISVVVAASERAHADVAVDAMDRARISVVVAASERAHAGVAVDAMGYAAREVKMSFGKNPHVAKAQAAEQKARDAKDDTARARAWRDAARLWDRAADRENHDKRRQDYANNAEAARSHAEGRVEELSETDSALHDAADHHADDAAAAAPDPAATDAGSSDAAPPEPGVNPAHSRTSRWLN